MLAQWLDRRRGDSAQLGNTPGHRQDGLANANLPLPSFSGAIALFAVPVVVEFATEIPETFVDAVIGRLASNRSYTDAVVKDLKKAGLQPLAVVPNLLDRNCLQRLKQRDVEAFMQSATREDLLTLFAPWREPDSPKRTTPVHLRFCVGVFEPHAALNSHIALDRSIVEPLRSMFREQGIACAVEASSRTPAFPEGLEEGITSMQELQLRHLARRLLTEAPELADGEVVFRVTEGVGPATIKVDFQPPQSAFAIETFRARCADERGAEATTARLRSALQEVGYSRFRVAKVSARRSGRTTDIDPGPPTMEVSLEL